MNERFHSDIAPAPTESILDAGLFLLTELKRLQPELQRTLDYTRGSHTVDDVVMLVLTGKARLWTTPRSFLIVEKVVYPQQTHYHIFLAGGDLDELRALHPEVIAAARADGACKLTLTGRRGWVRALIAWGWQEVMTTVELEI